jgi:hypothetical protein
MAKIDDGIKNISAKMYGAIDALFVIEEDLWLLENERHLRNEYRMKIHDLRQQLDAIHSKAITELMDLNK